MSTTNENNLYELTRGSLLTKALFILHWSLLIFAVFLFIIGRWKLGIPTIGIALLFAYISYRLAGGRRNPAIWKDEDLYDLLRHVALSGQAKIGFHSLRGQNLLLAKLESIGIRKKPSQDTRQFIRDKVVKERRAFDICRDDIIIQMIHNGKEWFWDGYGNKKTAQYFHKAEIIFDLKSSANYIFSEALEGLKGEDCKKKP